MDLQIKGSAPRVGVSLTEYNRRWHEIMTAFAEGRLAPDQASAAVRELTQQMVWR